MKHLHHIVPRHAGGTDDPSNLVELTVEEHAREHYILWNQHGRWEDKFAWKGLCGFIGKEEMISETRRRLWREDPVYREKMIRIARDGFKRRWESQDATMKEGQRLAVKAALSPESKQKRKDSFRAIEHNKGSKNPMFGKMWITNGSHSYRISKTDSIPEGYRKGRVCNKDS